MKISGRGWRKSLLRICIGVLLGIAPIIILLKTCGDAEVRSARVAVREWCRLAEFPKNYSDESLGTTGGMFTRGFRLSFSAPTSELQEWEKNSPGLRDANVIGGSGENIYEVKPARAIFCQVTIRKDGRVYIRTDWS
jgi:hypothetical protein